ncbi:MAG: methionine sulfoxide reductase [Firmicutes bacterium]|nr:methionine sulfoxide reductase [Bacillota bacterium]
MKSIVFAGGCFWGIEAYFKRIDGVLSTEVGYANGTAKNPDYKMVCRGGTGFAEACRIDYDEGRLSLEALLEAFWKVIDPTVSDRQGPDIGNQYRTGIYYTDPADLPALLRSRDQEQIKYSKRIVTEILPLENFYEAEEYHQDYLDKNPGGYCHIKL